MRQAIALAVIISLVTGLAGAWLFSQLSGSAGAAPSLQAREDQITIWADAEGLRIRPTASYGNGEWPGPATSHVVSLDIADYPSSLNAKFEATWFSGGGTTSCIRLYDKTLAMAISGGEVCHTSTLEGGIEPVRVRSGAMPLPLGEHEYVAQSKCEPELVCQNRGGMTVSSVRIIAEWTERTR